MASFGDLAPFGDGLTESACILIVYIEVSCCIPQFPQFWVGCFCVHIHLGGERTKTSHRLVASSLPDSSQKVCKTLLCYPLQQFAKLSCFFPIEKRCEWAWGKYSPPQDLQRGFWFFEVKVWLKAENQA